MHCISVNKSSSELIVHSKAETKTGAKKERKKEKFRDKLRNGTQKDKKTGVERDKKKNLCVAKSKSASRQGRLCLTGLQLLQPGNKYQRDDGGIETSTKG